MIGLFLRTLMYRKELRKIWHDGRFSAKAREVPVVPIPIPVPASDWPAWFQKLSF